MSTGMNGTTSRGVFQSIASLQSANIDTNTVVWVASGESYDIKTADGSESFLLNNGKGAFLRSVIDTYAMSEAEFNALAEKRIRDSAGSGCSEWGKHNLAESINQGLYGSTTDANTLFFGGGTDGVSRTDSAIALINGVQHKLAFVHSTTEACNITLPEAEDGTRTYDSTSGVVVQHADAATAFAAETATNKVILSRQDYVFIESWHELVADKDVHIPLGNVQYGAPTDDDGVSVSPLTGLGIGQGYSAFGEWDTATIGLGQTFSTMPNSRKQRVISNPDNNYYMSVGGLVQVRYRIRVVKGLGDNWGGVHPNTSIALEYGSVSRIQAQATGTSTPAMTHTESYLGIDSTRTSIGEKGSGAFVARDSRTGGAYNGLAFALPVALVQRGNQCAYHPVYNVNGFRKFREDVANSAVNWYAMPSTYAVSTAECFRPAVDGVQGGFHGSSGEISDGATGRNDQYEFYDAIYAGQVHDLRLSANKQDYNRLLEDGIHKAVAGETRGKGKLVFTKVFPSVGAVEAEYIVVNSDNAAAVVAEKELSPEYDSLPWVDIIGDPARIAATFPNGCVGQWVPVIPPSSGTGTFPHNRKVAALHGRALLDTNTGSWSYSDSPTGTDLVSNETVQSYQPHHVVLYDYDALADFTKPDTNRAVKGELGDVYVSSSPLVARGNRLMPSLTSQIGKATTSYDKFFKLSEYNVETNQQDLLANVVTLPTPIIGSENNSDAVKTLYKLVEIDGLLYVQYHGSQLIYDTGGTTGNEWGDTVAATTYSNAYGVIPIVDNESTRVDLNSNTVKTFTHTELIPIGIADYTESS